MMRVQGMHGARTYVPRPEARRARRAQRLRPLWPRTFARALIPLAVAPSTPPVAAVTEAIVAAEAGDRVKLPPAPLARVLAIGIFDGRARCARAIAARARAA